MDVKILFAGKLILYHYRPRSEASECYVFTGVCHSFCSTLGGGGGQHQRSTTSPHPWPGHNTPPGHVTTPPHPPVKLQHSPAQVTTPPPSHWPGDNTSPSQVTTPPHWPGHNTSPWPGHNTSPPLWPGHNAPRPGQVTTSPPWPGHNTSPPGPGHNTPSRALCAGGRYASYWNAFLFSIISVWVRESRARNDDRQKVRRGCLGGSQVRMGRKCVLLFTSAVANLRGRSRRPPPPYGPKLSQFHAVFFGKLGKYYMLAH